MRVQKNRTNIFDIFFLFLIFILLLGGALVKVYNNPIVKIFIPLLIFIICIYQYKKKNITNYLKFCVFINLLLRFIKNFITFLFYNNYLLSSKIKKYFFA